MPGHVDWSLVVSCVSAGLSGIALWRAELASRRATKTQQVEQMRDFLIRAVNTVRNFLAEFAPYISQPYIIHTDRNPGFVEAVKQLRAIRAESHPWSRYVFYRDLEEVTKAYDRFLKRFSEWQSAADPNDMQHIRDLEDVAQEVMERATYFLRAAERALGKPMEDVPERQDERS